MTMQRTPQGDFYNDECSAYHPDTNEILPLVHTTSSGESVNYAVVGGASSSFCWRCHIRSFPRGELDTIWRCGECGRRNFVPRRPYPRWPKFDHVRTRKPQPPRKTKKKVKRNEN